ncbi:phenylalanine-tRNA synthetase [Reticulomyxa filosa]|uniref:Phenylalanine-tRNA synthetase n=1 Tax=Reticulomyxa filosa TaxID=46433 RepID=X6P4G8_RETFI|nr:phenylalanine-tRNA synthetase [Reticulomyxa filosa]|eukprot:ETO33420.1 phenylalanine-tRNA synthetase [Reticulomyxa filosa]
MTLRDVKKDLKKTLESLINYLFPGRPYHPSLQMEVQLSKDKWLEIFGSGVIHSKILKNCKLGDSIGWVFGLGLERLAMPLLEIDDIRQFWNISFWVKDENTFHEHDWMEMVRFVAQNLVGQVQLIDEFRSRKSNHLLSKCFRISYRHPDRTLTNDEVNCVQQTTIENSNIFSIWLFEADLLFDLHFYKKNKKAQIARRFFPKRGKDSNEARFSKKKGSTLCERIEQQCRRRGLMSCFLLTKICKKLSKLLSLQHFFIIVIKFLSFLGEKLKTTNSH